MRIVDFAIRRPVTITVAVAVLIILGFFSFSRMAVDLYPDMKFPVAAIITSYSGAGPEEVESQITEPLESAIKNLSNIKEISSVSSEGSSLIIISFDWGTDMDNAALDIREKIGFVESFLPEDSEKPMVFKMDPNLMPVIQIGISGTENLAQLQTIAEDVIEPRLSRIPEVASVVITGGLEREVKVEVDPVKLESYGLPLAQVTQVLQVENFNMSGGKLDQGDRELFIRNLQEFESIEDIKNVAIMGAGGQIVYLRDIAQIEDGYKDVTQMTRVDGQPAVGIHCLKQTDANTVKACEAVKKELKQINKEMGLNLSTKVVMDQSKYINDSIKNTENMILEGALLAMLVLFIFLRNGRSTLIIFTAIPLSIIATFILMYFTNYSINLITMGGLALGVGRIVDDSIVVFENVYRHRCLGLAPAEAARFGASQVGNAVIASTLTIIAVFLPIVFVEGLASILFKPLAITICFAIICSLFVALTIIPLLSARLLTDEAMQCQSQRQGKISSIVNRFGQWLDNLGEGYKRLLQKSLQRRRLVVILVIVLMVGSLGAVPLVGAEFLPKMDSGELSITIETDRGSRLDNTDEITNQIEEKLKDIDEVETVFSSVGSSSVMLMGAGSNTDKATLYIKLHPKKERDRSDDQIAEAIREEVKSIPGAKIEVQVMDATSGMGGSGNKPINVQVRGDDLNVLRDLSNQVAEVVRKVPGTREVVASLTDGKPELQVKIDRRRAAAYGLTPMQTASEISTAMQGRVATRYKVEGDEVDVRVRYQPQNGQDINYLSNLSVRTPSGAMIKLSQIATFEIAQGPISIDRIDQVRRAEINAALLNRDLKGVMDDIKKGISEIELPAGYQVEYGGENKEMEETFSNLALALIMAIILTYAVMAVQYESFFNPFVIMFSIPTAFVGIVLGLLLTGKSFSVPAFIGAIMLVGIVVSNAIVFVDYLKQMIDSGMDRDEAIIETGRVRLRPILMTAFSTILAMVPLALGLREGSEAMSPLAIVVIGGLLVSTLVTLVLVPVVYSIFDDWARKFRQRRSAKRAGVDVNLS
ncbi:efflux RND transporter permease subunit [Syntrophomonas erecta]